MNLCELLEISRYSYLHRLRFRIKSDEPNITKK
nr:MAG TPA: hypothetical protein [Bacteriophage sp.]DAW21878.1 MAG TPA: hypothetical protein [Bacteriophage sp.]DAW87496.1 MAG TPA: hypothetical protein [Bacteriophage sp.]